MAVDSERLIERQRLKRRARLWQGLFLIAAAVAVYLLVADRLIDAETGDRIARLSVTGIIANDTEREEALRDLADDDQVKALVIRIDSPGGTFVGGESLYHAIRDVAEKKPVVAVMDGVAASAAYMIAVAGDHIVAREGTLTGSIGVIMQSANLVGLLESIGIEPESIKSDPMKGQPSPFEVTLPEARRWNQVIVDEMQDIFVGMVVQGRPNMAPGDVDTLADGRVYTGRQAFDNGLIDEIGGEAAALAWLAGERGIDSSLPIGDVKYGEDENWFVGMLTRTGKSLLPEPLTLDGLVAVWQPDLR
jgi:protease-4